jgi:hypothetical protein
MVEEGTHGLSAHVQRVPNGVRKFGHPSSRVYFLSVEGLVDTADAGEKYPSTNGGRH